MKKYFLHCGSQQQGPFDLEELKQKNITRDTTVWFEGISDWTTAGQLEELKSILISTPPPLKQTPPPPAGSKERLPSDLKKNKSSKRLTIGIVLLSIMAVIAFIMIGNNPNAIPGIKVQVNTPKPVVVTSRADDNKSGLFNARVTVYATVQNQGGVGNVLITFYCMQGGKSFDQSKSIYMMQGESQDINVTFEEVSYIDGKVTYRIEVKAE